MERQFLPDYKSRRVSGRIGAESGAMPGIRSGIQAGWDGLWCAGGARLRAEPGAGVSCAGKAGSWVCGGGLGAEGVEAFDGEDLLIEDEAELAGSLMGEGFETGKLDWRSGAEFRGPGFRFSRLVTGRSVMPQGLMRAKSRRSVVTLKAKPWEVMPRETWMPMAPILLSPWVLRRQSFGQVIRLGQATPDAGEAADAAGGDAEVAAEADERFFHEADKVDGAEAGAAAGVAEAAQVEDGVADELAGAVVGDVAAAVDLVERDAAAGEEFVGGEDVGAVGVAAEGEDGRVLEEQQDVVDATLEAEIDELRLEAEGFVVGDAAEIEVLNHA